jgi:hypothetical protein
MAELKQALTRVPYPDSEDVFINATLMKYSDKSLLLRTEFREGKMVKDFTDDEKKLKDESMKYFKSLGGKFGTSFTDAEGEKITGYIYSLAKGQKLLDWVAERSEALPTREEFMNNDELNDALKRDEEIVALLTYKSKQTLYELVGLEEKKTRTYEKAPKLIKLPIKLPIKLASSTRATPMLQGLPIERKINKLQEALKTIADAIKSGEMVSDFESSFDDVRVSRHNNGTTMTILNFRIEDESLVE